MDDVRLAEILDRVSKATPGPWGVWTSMDQTLDVLSELEHPYTPIISFYGDSGEHPSEREKRDADFVAHARTDVPDLLIALTEARAEIERLTAAGIEPSAEKALKTSAEAYRLVEEARQMRAERDAALARLRLYAVHMTNDRWLVCLECKDARRMTGAEIETGLRELPEPHADDCLLSALRTSEADR